MEDTLEQEETGYEYLLRRAGMEKPKRIETEKSHIGDWRDSYSDLKKIIRKEKRYVVDNDEVIPVEIMNGLMRVSNYEFISTIIFCKNFVHGRCHLMSGSQWDIKLIFERKRIRREY